MATTCTETLYIQSATSLKEKADKIDIIISGLLDQQIAAVANSLTDEYMIDDGQIKIKTIYRSADSIAKAIQDYERIKQQCLNQLNGRVRVLRPWQGMC
jgi:hypothetical protein